MIHSNIYDLYAVSNWGQTTPKRPTVGKGDPSVQRANKANKASPSFFRADRRAGCAGCKAFSFMKDPLHGARVKLKAIPAVCANSPNPVFVNCSPRAQVSNHSGGTGGGHYFTYAKQRDGEWCAARCLELLNYGGSPLQRRAGQFRCGACDDLHRLACAA